MTKEEEEKENRIAEIINFEDNILHLVKSASLRGEYMVVVCCGSDGELAAETRIRLKKKGFGVSVFLDKEMLYGLKIFLKQNKGERKCQIKRK